MGNWGDDSDFEAKSMQEYQGRFTINFKKIFVDVDEISEKTLEITDKHPKDSLLKLLAGSLIGMFLFFLFSYQVFALVMVPFIAFYIIALFRIYKCWKSFNYNCIAYWLMSISGIGIAFAAAQLLQHLIGNALF